MTALASVWDAVIIVAVVLAVVLLALAVLARRGRRVRISVDIDHEEDPPESVTGQ